jgi:hypothetical protein
LHVLGRLLTEPEARPGPVAFTLAGVANAPAPAEKRKRSRAATR